MRVAVATQPLARQTDRTPHVEADCFSPGYGLPALSVKTLNSTLYTPLKVGCAAAAGLPLRANFRTAKTLPAMITTAATKAPMTMPRRFHRGGLPLGGTSPPGGGRDNVGSVGAVLAGATVSTRDWRAGRRCGGCR